MAAHRRRSADDRVPHSALNEDLLDLSNQILELTVAPVPQRQGQAQPLLQVAEPGQPVLTPPVRP